MVIPLRIFVMPKTSGSVSAVTVTTTYTDLRYKTRQQVSYLGFVVAGSVDLTILDTSTYPQNITLGKPFSLTVTLINLGTTTAQSVIVVPNNATKIRPSSAQGIFLGDLTVNVPSSLTLTYIADNISSGVYLLRVQFAYKDDLGRALTDYLDVPARLTVSNSSSDSGSQPQRGGLLELVLPLVAIVAVVAVAVFLYRRRGTRTSGLKE
jgi:hypothetical protein